MGSWWTAYRRSSAAPFLVCHCHLIHKRLPCLRTQILVLSLLTSDKKITNTMYIISNIYTFPFCAVPFCSVPFFTIPLSTFLISSFCLNLCYCRSLFSVSNLNFHSPFQFQAHIVNAVPSRHVPFLDSRSPL